MHERTLYLGCDSIEHCPGNKYVLESWFEETPYGIVFENDGNTGYFYAAHTEQGILDALHIYNVKDVTDRDLPSTVSLLWDETFDLAALEINSYIHAIFDFIAHAGYCRNAFPKTYGYVFSTSFLSRQNPVCAYIAEDLLDIFRNNKIAPIH